MPVGVVILIDVIENIDRPMIDRHMAAALNRGMDRLLTGIELIQIKKYLSDAFPPRPPGSKYKRTFKLRSSSRTQRTGYSLDNMSGVWYADTGVADYAPEVIGPQAEQAQIHRGRWLSLEEIAQRTEEIGPQILQEEIDREIQIL